MKNKKTIVILGGGTAGWMTANIFAYSFKNKNIDIHLIESDRIPKIGVGEGSTPALKVFFDKLNIPEIEWMPKCHATYKCGITFKNWGTHFGFSEYYHPFASDLDQQSIAIFKRHADARRGKLNVESHPNRFFLSAYLAKRHLAPIPKNPLPFNIFYGYHFDSVLLGEFLKDWGLKHGVKHSFDTLENAQNDSNGNVQSLHLKSGKSISADLFVDCTGFASVLSQSHLNTPYKSYTDVLLNDSAVAIASPTKTVTPSQTVSTALSNGWAWNIPLTTRFGNGYVYSSNHISADEAEKELRNHIGTSAANNEARHLKMKVGRVEHSWNHNVLAVGLSQGFIEPLEATALLLIQQTASLFAHYYLKGNMGAEYRDTFNKSINEQFDGTRDYIVAHYITNSRQDSPYWLDARNVREHISDRLKAIFECWENNGDFSQEIANQGLDNFYPISSWYCLFAGMGLFAKPGQLKPVRSNKKHYDMKEVDNFFKGNLYHFSDHRSFLDQINNTEEQQALNLET